MNIIKFLTAKIIERAEETKTPCKLYATEEAAEKAILKVLNDAKEFYSLSRDIDYLIIFIPALNKWTAVANMSKVFLSSDFKGGYLGFVTDKNFYTF